MAFPTAFLLRRIFDLATRMTSIRISSLHVYPIKGCAGIPVASADVAVTGLVTEGVGDREWMVVDGNGRFLTQREHPRLAQVATNIGGGALHLTAPGVAPIALDLSPARRLTRDVVVWQSHVRGLDAGDDAAAWISSWLGSELRIVRFDRSVQRECNPAYAGESGAHTFFADGYPMLVIGRASLDDLNARLTARGSAALPMNRFRPNIVLEGLDPYAEDHLDTIEADGVTLRCVKRCVRCQVTTTDQTSAQVGLEPLRTLGEYRMDERLGGVTFGINAIVQAGAGRKLAPHTPVDVLYAF